MVSIAKSRRKVLLMGKSGAGKTSMRKIIFESQLSMDTRKLAATVDIEQSSINFVGGLKLSLWDCGGQDNFMINNLTSQASTVFAYVYSLIYIFDVESPTLYGSDLNYFLQVLSALDKYDESRNGSERCTVFVLLHKMDLIPDSLASKKLEEFKSQILKRCNEMNLPTDNIFFEGTSIYNDTLHSAWSNIISVLMPSLASLRSHLEQFLQFTSAVEVVLFEQSTFLVVSSVTDDSEESIRQVDSWDAKRFGKISNLVKIFKHTASARSHLSGLTLCTSKHTVYFDTFTPETYILIVAPRHVEPSLIELNVRLSKPYFNRLESLQSV